MRRFALFFLSSVAAMMAQAPGGLFGGGGSVTALAVAPNGYTPYASGATSVVIPHSFGAADFGPMEVQCWSGSGVGPWTQLTTGWTVQTVGVSSVTVALSPSASAAGACKVNFAGGVGPAGPTGPQGPAGPTGPTGPAAGWGTITGTLSAQTDLAAALGLKADASALTSGLATKADAATVTTALAAKADATALTSGLAGKADTNHNHAASAITSGTIAAARLGTGTASSATVLYGDNVFRVPPTGSGGSAAVWGGITGTLASQTDLNTALGAKADAATVTTALGGKADTALSNLSSQSTARTNLGLGTAATQPSSAFAGSTHQHAATDITTGTIPAARLGTGTASSSTVLYGDNVFRVPPTGSGGSSAASGPSGTASGGAIVSSCASNCYVNGYNLASHAGSVSGFGALGNTTVYEYAQGGAVKLGYATTAPTTLTGVTGVSGITSMPSGPAFYPMAICTIAAGSLSNCVDARNVGVGQPLDIVAGTGLSSTRSGDQLVLDVIPGGTTGDQTTLVMTGPASTYPFTHNLNNANPGFWCKDSSGYGLGSPGSAGSIAGYQHTSNSVTSVTFSAALSGITCTFTTGGVGPQGPQGPAGAAGASGGGSGTVTSVTASAPLTGGTFTTTGTIGLDTTKVAQKFLGTAAPGSVSGNLPGDLFTDTTNHHEYVCNAPSGTAAPACTSVSTAGWMQTDSVGGGGGTTVSVSGQNLITIGGTEYVLPYLVTRTQMTGASIQNGLGSATVSTANGVSTIVTSANTASGWYGVTGLSGVTSVEIGFNAFVSGQYAETGLFISDGTSGYVISYFQAATPEGPTIWIRVADPTTAGYVSNVIDPRIVALAPSPAYFKYSQDASNSYFYLSTDGGRNWMLVHQTSKLFASGVTKAGILVAPSADRGAMANVLHFRTQ